MLHKGGLCAECVKIKERGDRRLLKCFLLYTAHLGTRKSNVTRAQIELDGTYPLIKPPYKIL
jgi:hypothetical protein